MGISSLRIASVANVSYKFCSYRLALIRVRASLIWSLYLPPLPPMAQQPLVGQGLLIIEASRSHSDTPHSVGLFWRQRPLLDNTQHSQETDIHAPTEFEPTILASERPQAPALDYVATGIGEVST
jgi:hypothetical protein